MSRIYLKDDIQTAIKKISEEEPQVLNICEKLIEQNCIIDPYIKYKEWGPILFLDFYQIYGSRIWILYKNVCKENIVVLIALLRSVQLGILSEKELDYAINNNGAGIDIFNIYKEVREVLPRFADIEAGWIK